MLVLLVATSLRAVTYFDIREGPLLHLHAWSQSDMHFFDGWARNIAAGDLLTRDGTRPYHGRHIELACRAFVLTGGTQSACHQAEVGRLWDQWVGERSLWQDPGYPYFLAALYATFGRNPTLVYAAQTLMGLICVTLIYLIALRLFDRGAAVVAGMIAALFGPLVFYEAIMLRAVPIAAVGLGACYALMLGSDGEKNRYRVLFLAGVLAGLLCLLKFSWLLTVAVWAVLLTVSRARTGLAEAVRAGAVYGGGIAAAFSPLIVRNAIVGGPLLRSAATGPINFLNGNAADRVAGGGSAISDLAAPILVASGGDPLATLKATLATHESLFAWLGLLAAKLAMFFDPGEIPNNVNYGYFLVHAQGLSMISIGFVVVAVLAVLGLKAVPERRYAHTLVLASVVTGIAVCVLFFNLSRFRLPVACMMIPLAGGGCSLLFRLGRERRWPALAMAVLSVSALAVAMVTGARDSGANVRIADYGVANEIAAQMAARASSEGDQRRALAIALGQLETEPSELTEIRPGPQATSISVTLSGVAGTFVELHEFVAAHADSTEDNGNLAEHHRRRALVLRRLNKPYADSGLR
jgi:4-amino-4-deoxy-L-arabinose transferase-like glycosyltransferase